MERYQKAAILKDLKKKMVFLTGPRQVGKTTLSKEIAKNFKNFIYLNYDSFQDRQIIHEESFPSSVELIIFDEIHKMKQWKTYLKGVYDNKPKNQKILVTGSTRLEIFKNVGDSLAGRYFLHRLMPFSPSELYKLNQKPDLDRLLQRGGFPEPFLAKNIVDVKRWRMQYTDSLLREDVLDFDNIQNLKAIKLIFEFLQNRVGSPISYQSIAEDVSISVNTVKKYIDILEALYIIFKITPFSKNIARSLLKEPKIYFYDIGLLNETNGVKFENLIGLCLLKDIFYKRDYMGENYSLHYLRTKEKKEVDFAVIKDAKIEKIVEVKYKNHNISKELHYFHKKYHLPSFQICKDLRKEKKEKGIEILKGENFLKNLTL